MFEKYMKEYENIKEQIIKICSPYEIILFGSLAKKQIKSSSDIDICVVVDTTDKKKLTEKIYSEVNSDIPFDIVLYTVEEWEKWKDEKTSFLHKICKEGEVVYGR